MMWCPFNISQNIDDNSNTDSTTSNRVFQIVVRGGRGLEILLGREIFYRVNGIWEGVILIIQTFFKAKNSFLWILNIN